MGDTFTAAPTASTAPLTRRTAGTSAALAVGMKTTTLLVPFLSILFGVGVASQLGGCDAVDEAFDCAQICERYSDCFDADYDTEACRGRCEDNADTVDGFADKADDCENCLDDRSCTGSFACASECVGIVP